MDERRRMNKMREILSKISEGNTVDALSRKLGLRISIVRAMIDLMVHQGYLEEVRCGSGCSTCPMNCSAQSSKIKMYRLTEKGMECIRQG